MPDNSTTSTTAAPTPPNVNSLLANVPKLAGAGNHRDWKFAVMMVLRRAGLWSIVSEWLEKKKKAAEAAATATGTGRTTRSQAKAEADKEQESEAILTIIGLTIEPSQYQYIQDCTDGIEAWEALANLYEKDSRANRISLKRLFYTFQHESNDPIQSYISGITGLASQLRAIGISLSDRDVVDVLIFNLAEDYGPLASTLMAASHELSVVDVTSALLDEEKRRSLPGVSTAMVARTKTLPSAKSGDQRRCFRCDQVGHIARECPKGRSDFRPSTDRSGGQSTHAHVANGTATYAF